MAIILPALAMSASANELASLHTVNVRDLGDNLADTLVDRLSYRASKPPIHRNVELNDATLGKSSHFPTSRSSGALRQAIVAGHGINPQTNGGKQLGMTAIGSVGHTSLVPRHSTGSLVPSPYAAHQPFSQRVGVLTRAQPSDGTEFVVEQPRPTGIKWTKAPDGGIYVAGLDGNADSRVQLGDKLLEVSANFGDKIWKAESFPQCMMAIKTRIGPVYMKILSRGGNVDVLYMKDERDGFDIERAGGNYGAGTEAEMRKRANALKATEADRKDLFDDGVKKFQAGEWSEALEKFQMVQQLEPPNYIGDRFERFTQYYTYASYNVACCYSKLEEEQAGLSALKTALDSGWEDYDKIRSDEPLKFLRQSPKFQPLLDLYDEPIFVNPFKGMKNPFR